RGSKPLGRLRSGLADHCLLENLVLLRRALDCFGLRRRPLRLLGRLLAFALFDRVAPRLLDLRVHVALNQPLTILGQRIRRLTLSPQPCGHRVNARRRRLVECEPPAEDYSGPSTCIERLAWSGAAAS